MIKNNYILKGILFSFLTISIGNLDAQTCFVCPANPGTTGNKASAFGTNNSDKLTPERLILLDEIDFFKENNPQKHKKKASC